MSKFARINLETASPLDLVFNLDSNDSQRGVDGTLDHRLSKNKYFLPQDANVSSVRELVIDSQSKRKLRLGNRFVEKMEDNLVKWRPPLSSNRGTVMAIEGKHPYQIAAEIYAPNCDPELFRTADQNNGNATQRQMSHTMFDSFTHWWKENARGALELRRQQFEEEILGLSDLQDMDQVVEVTVAPAIKEEPQLEDTGMNTETQSALTNNTAELARLISQEDERRLEISDLSNSGISSGVSSQGTFLARPIVKTPPAAVVRRRQQLQQELKRTGAVPQIYEEVYNAPVPVAYLPVSNNDPRYSQQLSQRQREHVSQDDGPLWSCSQTDIVSKLNEWSVAIMNCLTPITQDHINP